MALLFKESICSICEKPLGKQEDIITWTAFLRKEHKFWKYSDSGMHRSCFENWERKEEFEHLYKYQPLIDFDDTELKKRIKKHGKPDWLKEVDEYRKK